MAWESGEVYSATYHPFLPNTSATFHPNYSNISTFHSNHTSGSSTLHPLLPITLTGGLGTA